MSVAQLLRSSQALGIPPSTFLEAVERVSETLDSQGIEVVWPTRGTPDNEVAWYLDSESIENLLKIIGPEHGLTEASVGDD